MYRIKTGLLLFALFVMKTTQSQTLEDGKKMLYYERYQSARNIFQKLVEANPQQVEAIYYLGQSMILPDEERMTAEAIIDFGGWLKKASMRTIQIPSASFEQKQNLLNELQSFSANYSPVVARLDYLPISVLLAKPSVLSLIPSGTIVSFVRPNWDLTQTSGTHQNISHQGFLFHFP
jgi:hypothetical protein